MLTPTQALQGLQKGNELYGYFAGKEEERASPGGNWTHHLQDNGVCI
jgi:hypothetical protein